MYCSKFNYLPNHRTNSLSGRVITKLLHVIVHGRLIKLHLRAAVLIEVHLCDRDEDVYEVSQPFGSAKMFQFFLGR